MHKSSATVKRNMYLQKSFLDAGVVHRITFFSLDHNVRRRRSTKRIIMRSKDPNEVHRVRPKDQIDPKLTPN